MTFEICLTFFILNFLQSVTPGPNMALIARATSRSGLAGGVAALTGVAVAEMLWALLALCVIGGAVDLTFLPAGALELFSAAALTALGVGMLHAALRCESPVSAVPALQPSAQLSLPSDGVYCRGSWSDGVTALCVGVTNPISLVFYLALAPMLLQTNQVDVTDGALFVGLSLLACVAAYAPTLSIAALPRGLSGRPVEWLSGLSLCAMGGYGLVQLVIA